jgi:glycosyltransferase involved in cell wall biosynthesis
MLVIPVFVQQQGDNLKIVLRIAFVACNKNPIRFRQDPSFTYRCENLAAGLKVLGHTVSMLHVSDLSVLNCFDVVVFHRPRLTLRLRFLLLLLRRKQTVLVADFDDLVIDEQFSSFSPGVVNKQVSTRKTRSLFRSHRQALGWFKYVTVSTQPLADELQRCFPTLDMVILPNVVHHSWRDMPVPVRDETYEKVVVYFPGTRSHDRDFETVRPAFERFLAEHPEVRMEITGPLTFQMNARPDQVRHRDKVPFSDYGGLFRGAWLNLAPLEETRFTRCKSALKVLEAGFWGVPTLCTPIPDADRFVGRGAIFADTADEWYQRLSDLLQPDCYNEVTQGLREKVIECTDIDQVATKFLHFVSGLDRS